MRTQRVAPALLLLASLMLVGAGCSQKASVSTSVDVNAAAKNEKKAPSEPAPPSAPVADSCGNPYYPFKAGLTITYGATTAPKATAIPDYTLSIVSVTGTSANLHVDMNGGASADMVADCAGGTVAMKGSFDLGNALQGAKMKTTVVSQSGTYFPASVAVGTAWSNAQTVKLEMTEGPAAGMGPITSNTSTESKVVGKESVTVPAGTYDAVKVEVKRTTATETPLPAGIKLPAGMKPPTPPPTTTTSTEWWVKGVGLVKNVTVSQGTTTTVVAKSITGQ